MSDRIVINPADLRRGARRLRAAENELRQSSCLLRTTPLPAMPPDLGMRVYHALQRTGIALENEGNRLPPIAKDLERRAAIAELAGGLAVRGRPLDALLNGIEQIFVTPAHYRFGTRVRATTYVTKSGTVVTRRAHWHWFKWRNPSFRMPFTTRRVHLPGKLMPKVEGSARAARYAARVKNTSGVTSVVLSGGLQFAEDYDDPRLSGLDKAARAGLAVATEGGGGFAGAVVGGYAGATAGAFVGSVVPIFGTAAGAAVGGVVGAAAGAFIGSGLGSKVKKKIFKKFW